MAYELRDFSDVAPATTVLADITNVSTTITITSGTGYPSGGASGDFIIQIESELVRCSSRAGTSLTVSGGVAGRGINGTTAVAHVAGVAVNHVHTAVNDSKEANYAVSKTVGKVTASQDLLVADAANSFTRLAIGANGSLLQAVAGSVAWGALGANTVGASQITDLSVGSAELAAGAVTAGKVGVGGISAANQFAAGVVDNTAIAANTIVGSAKISPASITAVEVAALNKDGLAATASMRTLGPLGTQATAGNATMGGDLAGTLPNPTIGAGKVTSTMLEATALARIDRNKPRFVTGTPTSGVYNGSTATILTLTIVDPGYDIDLWGACTIAASGTLLESWALESYVDGGAHHYIIIPFGGTGVNQSFASLIPPVTHSTGTNCTILIKWTRLSGSNNATIPADGVPCNGFVSYTAH